MKRLDDKIALITGAARGIGFAIAEAFAVEGAVPVLLDIDCKTVDEAVEKLHSKGFEAHGYEADVTDTGRITEVFTDVVKKLARIDILVNNAGVTRDNLIMRMKEDEWDKVIDINLKGTFVCTQKVSRFMLKQKKGAIVNIASVIGISGNTGQANYAASKGGIIALTKSAAKEFASRNIRVNAIAPGFIETEMTSLLSQKVVEKYRESIPANRLGSVQDVANLSIFLASQEAGYITGQTINVDGGLIM